MEREGGAFEFGAVNSVVEHYLDTVGVRGSNPLSRATSHLCAPMSYAFSSKRLRLSCNTYCNTFFEEPIQPHAHGTEVPRLRFVSSQVSQSNHLIEGSKGHPVSNGELERIKARLAKALREMSFMSSTGRV
jgi:hypothetical protein